MAAAGVSDEEIDEQVARLTVALNKFGEHVCGYGGAFFGGMCVSDCHTLQVDGDCFHSFNGLYSLVEDDNGPTLLNGQPQYTKHASRDPDPKHLYYQRNQ